MCATTSQFDRTRFISANLREFTRFENGRFEARPEYPNDAWYELLINAVVHRSYQYRNASIFIRLFDDRIEFESPDGFMPQVTPDTIYTMHRPRNRHLVFALKEFGEVKCMNEGTKRVRQEMEEVSLPALVSVRKIKRTLASSLHFTTTSQTGKTPLIVKHTKYSEKLLACH